MVANTSAILATGVAEVLLLFLLERLLQVLLCGAVCITIGAIFLLGGGDILASRVVNVSSDLEVEVSLRGRRLGSQAISQRVSATRGDNVAGGRLVRLETTGSICCDLEMAGKGRSNV